MLQARRRIQQETWRIAPEREPVAPVRSQSPRRGKARLFLTALACLFLCLAVIAQYSRIVSLNLELSNQKIKGKELIEEYRELETTSAQLGSLNRIERIAREELGMREPDRSQLRVLTAYLE